MPQLKAFVVEDNPVIRDSLVMALEELAPVRCVGEAADEPTAVRWLNEHADECDVVLIDIFLRDGSGLGVLREARLMGKPSIALVVLSNYATPDMRRKCSELGATRVFDKTADLDELLHYCSILALNETTRQRLVPTQ